MESGAIFTRLSCISFPSPGHSEEISSKIAQFWNLSLPAGREGRLAQVVHCVPLKSGESQTQRGR